MTDTAKYISKVEIKNLWGRYDISWDINPDVNILSGINGSGKSTILNAVAQIILTTDSYIPKSLDNMINLFDDIKITFNDNNYLLFQFAHKEDTFKNIANEDIPLEMGRYWMLNNEFGKPNVAGYWRSTYFGNNYYIFMTKSADLLNLSSLAVIDIISTFDNVVKPSEAVTKLSGNNVKTELDWELYQLQKKYLDYQLNALKKAKEIQTGSNGLDSTSDIIQYQIRFSDIIDALFLNTGKKLNRVKNEIAFLSGNEEISVYQLSSGEKQVLVILLTVLVQDCKPSILLMDEPEISLHFDWQKKLLQYIKELNPNVQIILATHSPAVIMEGWMNKVSEMSDLITLDRNASPEYAK